MPVRPSDAELASVVTKVFAGGGAGAPRLVERRSSPYRTSFPIEELQVELSGADPVRVCFKRLDWEVLESGAQLAKPRFLHDPEREPAVYGALLPQAPAGPPELFGALREADRHWLFVEWVVGRELFQVGERELWEEAARWLGRFHAAMASELDRHRRECLLLDHDAAFYRRWIDRAREFSSSAGGSAAGGVGWLAGRHEQVVEALLGSPQTVIHGEFYASNVLVASDFDHNPLGRKSDVRVAPVDWEMTAIGPGLTDLAALVSGWPEADRHAIAAAYASEAGVPAFSERDLDLARLQVAIQWLGWAPPEWVPPEGQRHDWLAEAVALAEELEL